MDNIDQIQKHLDRVRVELVNGIQIQGFFDKMRSKRVLSLEDCQEMIVPSLYPTDRQKASHFLDVIATRGKHGYDVLLECLDEQYPHLYKTLTGSEPSPRPHMPKSPTVFNFTPGFGNMLEEISTQNYQLQHDNAEKTYIIEKLTEEREYLASQQNMFAEKMENYQQVIQRTKQLEGELWELKDELLNLFLRVSQTEKERDKYKRFLKKSNASLHEYQKKLELANTLLNSKIMYTQRTEGKYSQLSRVNSNLQKEIQQIKMEMESAKRQSLVYLGGSFSESFELDKDSLIDLLKQDKDAALRECEDVSEQLRQARQQILDQESQIEQRAEETKDLQYVVEVNQRELNAFEKNYNLLCHELQITNRNYKTVAEQRRQLQAEVDRVRQENEQRQTQLQEQLSNYRTGLRSEPRNLLRQPPSRSNSFLSVSSGISSMRGSFYDDTESGDKQKSETLPRPTVRIKPNRPSQKAVDIISSRDSVHPMSRPRTRPIQRGDSGLQLDKDTFPESQIPSTDNGGEDDDGEDTFDKISRHFAARPETFSESLQGHHGSWKKKDRAHYENVDLTLNAMRKTIIKRPAMSKLGMHSNSMAVDLDDESEELAKILGGKTSSESQNEQASNPEVNGHDNDPNWERNGYDDDADAVTPTQDMNGHDDDVIQHQDMNGHDGATPPLPVRQRNNPKPSKTKVSRTFGRASSHEPDHFQDENEDEPRHRSLPNDFFPSPVLTRNRLQARRSNPDDYELLVLSSSSVTNGLDSVPEK